MVTMWPFRYLYLGSGVPDQYLTPVHQCGLSLRLVSVFQQRRSAASGSAAAPGEMRSTRLEFLHRAALLRSAPHRHASLVVAGQPSLVVFALFFERSEIRVVRDLDRHLVQNTIQIAIIKNKTGLSIGCYNAESPQFFPCICSFFFLPTEANRTKTNRNLLAGGDHGQFHARWMQSQSSRYVR